MYPNVVVEFNVRVTSVYRALAEDSPANALYTEVMGKLKPKVVEGDSSPDVPQKQLTEEDLDVLMDEEVPTVPQQNVTTEDIQRMDLSAKVLKLWISFDTACGNITKQYQSHWWHCRPGYVADAYGTCIHTHTSGGSRISTRGVQDT